MTETAKRGRGRPPKAESTADIPMMIRLSKEDLQALGAAANERGLRRATLARMIIIRWLKENR